MCYAIHIATCSPQPTSAFIPNVTKLNLEIPTDEELTALKNKFTLPYIYYVGSDTKCSCGFEFHSRFFDDPEWQDSKASPQELLNLLNKLTADNDVEYYCCWDGNWDDPIVHNRVLNSREITLEDNYFELVEDEFICFKKDKEQI